jgi:hypothetical protein
MLSREKMTLGRFGDREERREEGRRHRTLRLTRAKFVHGLLVGPTQEEVASVCSFIGNKESTDAFPVHSKRLEHSLPVPSFVCLSPETRLSPSHFILFTRTPTSHSFKINTFAFT